MPTGIQKTIAELATTEPRFAGEPVAAIAPLGVRATETPASPQRLWKLLQQAKPNP